MHRVLVSHLFKVTLAALIALVLYGALPGAELAVIVVLFLVLRICYIVAEARREPPTLRDQEELQRKYVRAYEMLPPEQRRFEAISLGLGLEVSPAEFAREQVARSVERFVPARAKRELAAEILGLVGVAAFAPLDVALYTNDFFSLRILQSWAGAALVASCALFYAWPHLAWRSHCLTRRRILWWVIPFAPAAFLLFVGIKERHPYLNPFHPEQMRLAAERVLALESNVVAGRHADWVLRYARHLDAAGDRAAATYYYREGLRLDSGVQDAAARLAALESEAAGGSTVHSRGEPNAFAPFWASGQIPRPSVARAIDRQLEQIEEFSIIIVPIGEVDRRIIEAAGDVVQRELSVPVILATSCVPLPTHTRVRGLVTGRQWDYIALLRAFQTACEPFPVAPVKYLLITPVDIYGEGMNFAFSVSFSWGGIISLSRLGDPMQSPEELRHRAAKQALCAVIKSFDVPISPDRRCVTSYSRSLEEFDRKGNRPTASTLALFGRKVAELNDSWQQHRSNQQD